MREGENEDGKSQGKLKVELLRKKDDHTGIVAVTTICLAFVWDYLFLPVLLIFSFHFVLLFFPNTNLLSLHSPPVCHVGSCPF